MSQKTIVYIGGFEMPDKNAAAHRVLTNAKILRELGFNVILIGVREGQLEDIAEENYHGFATYNLKYPNSDLEWLKRYFVIDPYLTVLRRVPQDRLKAIVFYNEKAFLQYRVGAWARARNIKVIGDVTEWYAHSGWGPGSLFKKLDVAVRMHVLNRIADGLITTSGYITNYYADRGVPRQKIVELPTLFDTQIATAARSRESSPREGAPLTLIYCGNPFNVGAKAARRYLKERLDQTVDVFLRIRELRPSATLSVFGVTGEQFLRYYPSFKSKLDRCASSLRFHGVVPNRIVLDEIAKGDLTIFFRDTNRVTLSGFPTKFAESITYGTPVITNHFPSIDKYVVPGNNCFIVDPADTAQLQRLLEPIAGLDAAQIAKLKRACAESRLFDFREYVEAVSKFIGAVGV